MLHDLAGRSNPLNCMSAMLISRLAHPLRISWRKCNEGRSLSEKLNKRSYATRVRAIPANRPGTANLKKPAIPYKARPLIDKYAQRSSPTLLYQAPSPVLYQTGCYLLAGFCFTWAGYNVWNTFLDPLVETGNFVKFSIGGVCGFMITIGGYIFPKVC